ncbi:MAG: penicillin-binding transpeptidase domain-containing protein, partial [Phycisphaeraceae bacterium]
QQADQLWQLICEQGRLTREELDKRKAAVIERVQMIRADVWQRLGERRAAEMDRPVELSDIAVKIREQSQPHVLLPGVDPGVGLFFRKREDQLPGVHVIPGKRRDYPLEKFVVNVDLSHLPGPMKKDATLPIEVDALGGHLLGTMRDVWARDVAPAEGRPFRKSDGTIDLGGYLPGDSVGAGGVEQAEESVLRGTRGRVEIDRITGREIVDPAQPGRDVRISIDTHLQARIQAAMDPRVGLMAVQDWHNNKELPVGTPLNGAVVVLEVDTGRILAMVSSPADETPVEGLGWPTEFDFPQMNRPIAAIYPPGSTLKPIVYAIASRDGAIAPDQRFDCEGHFYPGKPNIFRCWGWRPAEGKYLRHGPLDPVAAIAQSCDIYFYNCGHALGPRKIIEGLHDFGFARKCDLGLPEEVSGILPSLDKPNPKGRELSDQNAMLLGIGQGPIAVPPMQVAAAHAALARGGYYLAPILFTDHQEQQQARDLHITPHEMNNILQGMYESANTAAGSGNHINFGNGISEKTLDLPDITVRSKTGTAEAPKLFIDADKNGKFNEGDTLVRSGDHSWYVCHVQRPGEERAAFVIVALVEYGGSGGRCSGPLVNQVLWAMRAEGYF